MHLHYINTNPKSSLLRAMLVLDQTNLIKKYPILSKIKELTHIIMLLCGIKEKKLLLLLIIINLSRVKER